MISNSFVGHQAKSNGALFYAVNWVKAGSKIRPGPHRQVSKNSRCAVAHKKFFRHLPGYSRTFIPSKGSGYASKLWNEVVGKFRPLGIV